MHFRSLQDALQLLNKERYWILNIHLYFQYRIIRVRGCLFISAAAWTTAPENRSADYASTSVIKMRRVTFEIKRWLCLIMQPRTDTVYILTSRQRATCTYCTIGVDLSLFQRPGFNLLTINNYTNFCENFVLFCLWRLRI